STLVMAAYACCAVEKELCIRGEDAAAPGPYLSSPSYQSLFHEFEHSGRHGSNRRSNRGLRDGCELARVQARQRRSSLITLRDLHGIDGTDVKINGGDGVVGQAVLRKIFTAHGGVDQFDVLIAKLFLPDSHEPIR